MEKNIDIEVIEDDILDDVIGEDEETITEEDLLKLLESLEPKVEVNTENIQGLSLNKEEFERALEDMSYVCGQIIALKSVGCTTSMAFDYICAKEGIALMNITE